MPPAPTSRKNLILRFASTFAVLALVYLSLRWDLESGGGWYWTILIILVSVLCLREFYRLASASGVQTFAWLGLAAGPLWLLALEWDLSRPGGLGNRPALASLVLVIFLLASMILQLVRRDNQHALASVGVTVLGFLYCSFLPGFIIRQRHLALPGGNWLVQGMEFVVVCIFVTKVSDVGALLAGRRWGRHKLIPRLSPGKTWEGAVGGVVSSVLLLQFMAWTDPGLALNALGRGNLVLLSLLLALAALAGDLVESCFKRNSRMKDAGSGVPGFGGILDLADSLIVAAPLMYLFLLAYGASEVIP
ncbi:MAG: phosphatidate cytidylyltransferase [Planctomycetota bacterium]|jgi:phosphatidate cytidylyltransferase|nr:phosphatidate cytidylyltransferase [Planctomycetota bacterium]